MPEIIEVKNYADFISKKIKNKQLLNIKIINGRYKNHKPFELYNKIKRNLPLLVLNVNTKGKFMYIKFEKNFYIGITLGLSGGWFYKKNNSNKLIHGIHPEMFSKEKVEIYINNAIKHINVEFQFEFGTLYFYDQLSFGTIKIFNEEELNIKLNKIGLDIMDVNTTLEMFINKIMQKKNLKKLIGNILLNQKLISGVGNYLRADSLWLSKISPFRKIKDLTNDDLSKLYYNLRLLTWTIYNKEKAIKLNIIKKIDKIPINYKTSFLVYGKDFDIYNNKITKEQLYEGSQIRYIYWSKKYQI
jgi:formamidopyrimidine-DNA glycosylase